MVTTPVGASRMRSPSTKSLSPGTWASTLLPTSRSARVPSAASSRAKSEPKKRTTLGMPSARAAPATRRRGAAPAGTPRTGRHGAGRSAPPSAGPPARRRSWRAARARGPRRSGVAAGRRSGRRERRSPDLPRRVVLFPQAVQVEVVAVGVHGMPEALVQVDRELAVARELAQRLLLQEELRIVVQVVEDLALEDEEAAAD